MESGLKTLGGTPWRGREERSNPPTGGRKGAYDRREKLEKKGEKSNPSQGIRRERKKRKEKRSPHVGGNLVSVLNLLVWNPLTRNLDKGGGPHRGKKKDKFPSTKKFS